MKKHVVVGGGITGLFTALLLSEKLGGDQVVLIEKGQMGGLLRSFSYDDAGQFDIGTHIPAETGLESVDSRLAPFLTGAEWQKFEDEKKDLAGVYFESHLNEKSIAPDLNVLTEGEKQTILSQIMELSAQESDYHQSSTLEEFLNKKYGEYFTDHYLRKIFNNFYQSDLSELDPFAVNLMPIFRLHFFEGEEFDQKVSSDYLRDVFAYPDQRKIPKKFTSGLKSFYPKKVGIQRFVNGIIKELETRGVVIKEGSNIEISEKAGKTINEVTIDGEKQNIERLYWTAGLMPYAKFFGHPIDFKKFDQPRTTAIVNLAFKEPLESKGCYYYYDLSPSNDTYRITLYQNFTEKSSIQKVTVEVITDHKKWTDDTLVQSTLNDLIKIGLLAKNNELIFSAVEFLPYGFPKPTLKNQHALSELRDACNNRFDDVSLLGLNTKDGLFFYRDILKDVYQEIMQD